MMALWLVQSNIRFVSSIANVFKGGVVNALACYWNYTIQSYSTVKPVPSGARVRISQVSSMSPYFLLFCPSSCV
ncbi:hypothetical protein BST61_g8097 [Cercospora zeina]